MKKKDASSTKEDEWLENQNLLMFKLIDSYEQSESGTSESMEDDLFGHVVAKSIAKYFRWRDEGGIKNWNPATDSF